MNIIPKNWNTFQHYKTRSPAWIKLHRGLLNDFAFSRLPVASRALAPLLWLLASEYEGGKITADVAELAFRFRMTSEELCEALNPLIDAEFFKCDSEALAACKHGAILEKRREEIQVEKEKTLVRSQKAIRTISSQEFTEFRKVYPRRLGADPKRPAEEKFNALVKQGVDPRAIIEGARRCAVADADKIGTPYIPQAVKWLRDRRWEDYQPPPAIAGPWQPPPGAPSDEELRKKYGQQHHAISAEAEAPGSDGLGADHAEELRRENAEIRPRFRPH